jgi:murein DD-endopeptidase MepM/ murein hydrolase activator NlpD
MRRRNLLAATALLVGACQSTPDRLVYGLFHPGGNWPTTGQEFEQPIPLVDRSGVEICSDYASMRSPSGYGRPHGRHPGIDFCGSRGTPILAAASGRVIDYSNAPGGQALKICHDQPVLLDEYLPKDHPLYGKDKKTRVCTAYEHLAEKTRTAGKVERGEVIGTMGRTGSAVGVRVHLHFEVLKGSTSLSNQHANPHLFWAGGAGDLTCFDSSEAYPENRLKLTLPVPCG